METTVEYDAKLDEYVMILPDELLEEMGWKEGDDLVWEIDEQGRITLRKYET